MPRTARLTFSAAAAALAVAAPLTAIAQPTPLAGRAPAHDVTTPEEANRVDSIDVSNITWEPCYPDRSAPARECATLPVPLDYNNPTGEKYPTRVLRVKATNPAEKIGTLFVNPGGPGGSAMSMAARSYRWMPDEILAKFDIVGVEPRGIGLNPTAQCFDTDADHDRVANALFGKSFPETSADRVNYFFNAMDLGRGCRTYSNLQAHMSTAQMVRDIDVARRAVGDDKLTFLGFSYGTQVGQVYANMFPDRVRAIVNDGVIDGADWVGAGRHGQTNLDVRLRSAEGAELAFNTFLELCDATTADRCEAAATDDSAPNATAKWAAIEEKLKNGPIAYEITALNGKVTIHYATKELILGQFLSAMYRRDTAPERMAGVLQNWWLVATNPPASDVARKAAATLELERRTELDHFNQVATGLLTGQGRTNTAYNGWVEGLMTVMCTDGNHPMSASLNMRQADGSRSVAPNFGPVWSWNSVACSRDVWSTYDRSAYFGPFNKRTSNRQLFVGNLYDPATNQVQAETAAKRHPGAALITSKSWGHTAYGTSACVTDAVNTYLLTGNVADRTECVADAVPFSPTASVQSHTELPPVVPHGLPLVTGLLQD